MMGGIPLLDLVFGSWMIAIQQETSASRLIPFLGIGFGICRWMPEAMYQLAVQDILLTSFDRICLQKFFDLGATPKKLLTPSLCVQYLEISDGRSGRPQLEFQRRILFSSCILLRFIKLFFFLMTPLLFRWSIDPVAVEEKLKGQTCTKFTFWQPALCFQAWPALASSSSLSCMDLCLVLK